MIANYGYTDGSGEYYISIDTAACTECEEKGCVGACVSGVFEIEPDDFDDEVAVVRESVRNSLKTVCSGCKPTVGRATELPCEQACEKGKITHSW
jgi:hypothetical protein